MRVTVRLALGMSDVVTPETGTGVGDEADPAGKDQNVRRLVEAVMASTGITGPALARKIGVTAQELRNDAGRALLQQPRALAKLRAFAASLQPQSSSAAAHAPPPRTRPEIDYGLREADGVAGLAELPEDCIDAIISDIPYGIGLDDWDVLHPNANSAYMGQSDAQRSAGKVFARRRKPLNGWSQADRQIPAQYQAWCATWAEQWLRVLKPGASVFVFAGRRHAHRCMAALEDAGFIYRDQLAWIRPRAVFRAQRLATVLRKRGALADAKRWQPWRVGNLRPVFEPIHWLFKPYTTTIADNVLEHGVGAFNAERWQALTGGVDNLLRFGMRAGEGGLHEAQKPVDLLKCLIELCTPHGAVVLDPFAGSGSTGVAAWECGRRFVLFERDSGYAAKIRDRLAGLDDRPGAPPLT